MKKSILPTIGVIIYIAAIIIERYFFDLPDVVYNTAGYGGIILVVFGFIGNIIRMNKDKNKKEH